MIHPTFSCACHYLSMLGLKLSHVSKRAPDSNFAGNAKDIYPRYEFCYDLFCAHLFFSFLFENFGCILLQSIIPLATSQDWLICLTWNQMKCINWMLDQLCDFKPYLTHDFDLGFLGWNFEIHVAVFQEWNHYRLTWNEKNWVHKMLDPICDVDLQDQI